MKNVAFLLAWGLAFAQSEAPKPQSGRIIGEVTAKEAGGKQLTVKADSGSSYTVALDEKTSYRRVPLGETDARKATAITLQDVGVGDRVMARGAVNDNQKSVTATSIYVMTKADIAQKHQREQAEWQKRGATGLVKSVNAAANEIEIVLPARREEPGKTLVVAAGPKTTFRRYAPDSVRFADATISAIAEVQPGDQLRVLGDKSADGARIAAEEVVSGSFKTIAGTVLSVDLQTGVIALKDLDTKKPITVKTNASSQLRKLPPMVATMLARRLNPTMANAAFPGAAGRGGFAPGGGAGGPGRAAEGAGAASGFPARSGEGPGGGRGGDIQQMLERAPAFALADLKPGDPIIISSTVGADKSAVTAITILLGVEPILVAAPAGQLNLGAWSLDMQMPQ